MSGIYHYEDKNRRPCPKYSRMSGKPGCYKCESDCLCQEDPGMSSRSCFDQMQYKMWVEGNGNGDVSLPPINKQNYISGWK